MKWKTVDINVDDPNEVLILYASRLYELDNWEDLTQEQGQNVFVHIVSDYYDYGLGLDVLISIAGLLSEKWRGETNTEFEDLLISLADLEYSLRHVTNDERSNRSVIVPLREMYNYFEKYKHQVGNK